MHRHGENACSGGAGAVLCAACIPSAETWFRGYFGKIRILLLRLLFLLNGAFSLFHTCPGCKGILSYLHTDPDGLWH